MAVKIQKVVNLSNLLIVKKHQVRTISRKDEFRKTYKDNLKPKIMQKRLENLGDWFVGVVVEPLIVTTLIFHPIISTVQAYRNQTSLGESITDRDNILFSAGVGLGSMIYAFGKGMYRNYISKRNLESSETIRQTQIK